MNYYAVIQGINSVCALTITLIIFFNKSRKPIQIAYGVFSLLLFLWAFFYFNWGFQINKEKSLFWMRLVEFPICFIHTAYFHFMLIFSNSLEKYKKYLYASYAISIIAFFINCFNGFFDLSYIRNKDPFYYWPHATPWTSLFIATEISFVILSFWIVFHAIKNSAEPLKTRLKYYLIIAIIGWSGGLLNWCYFYDSTPIPPVGNPAVTLYLLGTFYLMIKHDLLALNLVIRRTFVYGSLTLIITLIYTIVIIVSEKVFQSYFGYNSFIGTILAGIVIALLFNPLRSFLIKFIETNFFGKSIEALSTENIQMRHELQNQDRMKAVSTLAAGMAHEIKNPLTAIKTFTEHLPNKSKDPEFISKFQKVVGSEVEKIDSIVRELLEFSKPAPLKLERANIEQIIDETLQLLNAEFIKHNINVEKILNNRPTLISGDSKQLKQVFLNLFLNSIQAMPRGGVLTVSTSLTPGYCLLTTISDTGIGIPKENIPHIFDPFFTTKESGTGLGLAIVHGIIKEHKGKIEVTSHLGTGTEFRITFKNL